MNTKTNKLLLAGEYICPVRFNAEFRQLESAAEFRETDTFLRNIGLCLCRLGESGAFFASNVSVGAEDIKQIKADLLNFRDVYGPYVLALEQIRQSMGSAKFPTPGEFISVYELEGAVNSSSVLESGLNALVSQIPNASPRFTHHENIKRMLEHLVKGGFAILTNKDTNTYQLTGKLDQLYLVLQYLRDHAEVPEQSIDVTDGEGQAPDLFSDDA